MIKSSHIAYWALLMGFLMLVLITPVFPLSGIERMDKFYLKPDYKSTCVMVLPDCIKVYTTDVIPSGKGFWVKIRAEWNVLGLAGNFEGWRYIR
jgi:hypothetical protein